MRKLQHFAQQLRPDGNFGENITRVLGTPDLGPLHTVIRESVQNIADAALKDRGPEILIRIRRLNQSQREVLRDMVFGELPRHLRDTIGRSWRSEGARVLELCDFSTSGLEGPIRADQFSRKEDPSDWVDFVLNIGVPRDTEGGGGTYGFGKAALYGVSRCQTILVDSRLKSKGERRLICCHWGKPYNEKAGSSMQSYTGRHWWGKLEGNGLFVGPVTGVQANQISRKLGLPARTKKQSGTSIFILDFDPGGTEAIEDEEIGQQIVEFLLWSFWPRMTADCPIERRFKCRVQVNGTSIAIPAPEYFPPLDLFAKALADVRNQQGWPIKALKSYRYRLLGRLSLKKGLAGPRHALVRPEISVIPAKSHFVALMRPVELVVKYLEGPPLEGENVEWAGVFRTDQDSEVEQVFADAEPPAHDDWVHRHLKDRKSRSYVRTAIAEIKNRCREAINPPPPPPPNSESNAPLAKAATELGRILTHAGATKNRINRGRKNRATARSPHFDRLELVEGKRIAVFKTRVTQDSRSSGKAVKATAVIMMEGRPLHESDENIENPRVLSVSCLEPSETRLGDWIEIAKDKADYEIRVHMPPDCAVQVSAKVLTEIPA